MSFRLVLVAAFVALLWAGNFVVTQAALDAHVTPLLLVALRFSLASSLMLVTPRPVGIRWQCLALIGLGLGVGQFGLATMAMQAGLSPGFTALVLQMQCLATSAFAFALLGERISIQMLGGSVLALVGMAGLVATQVPSPAGLALAIGAALIAASINIVIKRFVPPAEPVRMAVWISPFPVLPLLALSCLLETSPLSTFRDADPAVLAAAIVYGGVISTVAGTALWARLLHQAPASRLAPFTLLVPVFGAALSALIDCRLPAHSIVLPFCVVLVGLAITQLGCRSPALVRSAAPGSGLEA